MDDNKFIQIYNQEKVRITTLTKKFPEIKQYIKTRFADSNSQGETVYRILNGIIEKPLCPICNKQLEYNVKSGCFLVFCSSDCAKSQEGIKHSQNNLKKTLLEKYGVEHALQSPEIKNKAIQTNIARYGVEHALQSPCFKDKFKNTMQTRYNVDYTGQSSILQQKMQETSLSRYGVNNPMKNNDVQEKVKQTCLKKYGVEYVSQSDICKKHMQENNLLKYGVKFTTQLDSVKQKVKETNIKRYGHDYVMKFINKGKQTKKNNNTYITSKVEETLYSKLCKYFGSQNIYRQWNSDCYPFNCNFYIKTYDLYIEIQGSWTHGPHPYDSNNSDDLILKNKWIEKNTDYYKSALDVWTGKDVLKRTYAQNNNLNFIEIFSINATYCFDTIMLYISLKETGYKCY